MNTWIRLKAARLLMLLAICLSIVPLSVAAPQMAEASEGMMNVAAGIRPTFSSHHDDTAPEAGPSRLTNGIKTTADYIGVGASGNIVYAQLDLEEEYEIGAVAMWFYPNGRLFKDVIVQISETEDFSSGVTTVFNNDKNNSAGQGVGEDDEYAESAAGKSVAFEPVTGRYVRFWIGGNSQNSFNQFTEVEVYASASPTPTPEPPVGDVYYMSTDGDDGNDGLTKETPKQSLSAATALMEAGKTILFKRGDAWYNAALNLNGKSGTADNPITIGAYGSGPKPIIAGLDLLDEAGWTFDSATNLWRHAVSGYSDARRIFVNGVSKIKRGSAAEVDESHEWAIAGGFVYVNTGSAVIPPVSVEVLPTNQTYTLQMKDTHYVSISHLDFRGSNESFQLYINAPTTNISFDHIVSQRTNKYGLIFEHEYATGAALDAYHTNISVTNSFFDKTWAHYENEPPIHGDGIYLRHAVEGGLIANNKIINFGHTGIGLEAYKVGAHGIHHVIVENNEVSGGASGYLHALSLTGFEGLATNNTVRGNYFHDYTTTGHILGSQNKIYSNIFAGVRVTQLAGHSPQPYATDWVPWATGGVWHVAHDNFLINNTFADIQEFAVMVADNPGNPAAVDNNIIANNIMYDWQNSYFGEISVNISASVRGAIPVKNNNFWNFSEDAPVARYKNTSPADNYNAAGLNEICAECSANTQLDPRFADAAGRDFRLTDQTPNVIASGGTNEYATIMGEGFKDYFGREWDAANPSMGAIQYQAVNPGKAAISGPSVPVQGQEFELEVSIEGVTDPLFEQLYAQEVTVQYDPSRLKFIGAESLKSGFSVLGWSEPAAFQVRIVGASDGTPIDASGNWLKLTFEALPVPHDFDTEVALRNVVLANGDGDELSVYEARHVLTVAAEAPPVDKSVLQSALDETQTLLNKSTTGGKWGQYPAAAKDQLQNVFNQATAVHGNGSASQYEVDQAIAALQSAVQALHNSVNTTAGVGDLGIIAKAYGKAAGDTGWNEVARYDRNGDSILDVEDLAAMARIILGVPAP